MKDENKLAEKKEVLYHKTSGGSPISNNGIIARINSLNNRTTSSRMYTRYHNSLQTPPSSVDYSDLVQSLNYILKNKISITDFFGAIHKILTTKMNCFFTAFGTYHNQANYINLKLIDRIGGTYSSRVFASETENPVIECYQTKCSNVKLDSKFLNIPYLQNSTVAVIPLLSVNNCIGVMLIGDNNAKNNMDLYSLLANYLALFVHNSDLIDRVNKNTNIDSLTLLNNHRGFQEVLSNELAKAEAKNSQLSVIMMDINNISKINRELGHAKGDEVIKLVAEKVKQNIRSSDSAGRYGGDEIAIILPDTDTDEAKYIAEYLTYSLSCCFVDDVGPVKVAVGIATFPESTKDQEKLLILAEQAMYISQSRGYKDGMSSIVSSSDYNFWDDMALNSFAEVLTKRHAQIGISFEEELVHKFNNEQIISQNHLIEMVTSLASAIDAKDTYTKGHSSSVSRYSAALARAINLPENEVERIALGALLHDVGKIGIPENVLRKPTNLSDAEWEIMRQHPVIGAEKVLMPNESLRDLIPIVKYHHENWDGSGYPEKLKGEQIPLSARIVAIADAYHALISDRPYRKGLSVQKACEILKMGSNLQWDTNLVRQFIQIAPSISTMV
ncbi:MAG: diguanylate cyclase [Candidatus Gastranaerophilales bacterium]|nr:diguanylate cyclase [Candidatus Gastranaerophilales bacterium]